MGAGADRRGGRRGGQNREQNKDRQHQQRRRGPGGHAGGDLAEGAVVGGDHVGAQVMLRLVQHQSELGGNQKAGHQSP